MADTKILLKVPYRDGHLRVTPFNDAHMTALTMAQQLKSDARKVNVVLRILSNMLGDESYEQITNDLVDGLVTVPDLFELLNASVLATTMYRKAKAAQSGPETDGDE